MWGCFAGLPCRLGRVAAMQRREWRDCFVAGSFVCEHWLWGAWHGSSNATRVLHDERGNALLSL